MFKKKYISFKIQVAYYYNYLHEMVTYFLFSIEGSSKFSLLRDGGPGPWRGTNHGYFQQRNKPDSACKNSILFSFFHLHVLQLLISSLLIKINLTFFSSTIQLQLSMISCIKGGSHQLFLFHKIKTCQLIKLCILHPAAQWFHRSLPCTVIENAIAQINKYH